MREIKFRFWDGERMLDDHEGWSEGIGINQAIGYSRRHYGYELMQFTGLHDKNGTSIWEGDILFSQKITDTMPEEEIQQTGKWTVEVVFEDGSFCYGHNGDPLDKNECLSEMEVIGNIYESPEKLTWK